MNEEGGLDDRPAHGIATGPPDRDGPRPDVPGYDFGYGGWTVTVAETSVPAWSPPSPAPAPAPAPAPSGTVPVGEPSPQRVADAPPEPQGAVEPAQEPGSARGLRSRLRARRPAEDPDPASVFAGRPGDQAGRTPSLSYGGRPASPDARPAAPIPLDRPADPEPVHDDPPSGGRKGPARRARSRRGDDEARAPRQDAGRPSGARGGEGNRRSQRVNSTGSVVIEDRLFELVDWSSGGLAIRSDAQLYRAGDARPLELEIDLGDYAVNLDLQGEVVNRSSDRTGWRFVEPSETQRQVLRALTHAATHDRAFVAPRALPTRAEAPEPPRPAEVRPRRPRSALAAVISLPLNAAVILALAGIGIAMIGKPPATRTVAAPAPQGIVQSVRAAVAMERVPLTAGVGGLVLGWAKRPGDAAAPGEALVTIAVDGEGGEPAAVVSPCDCILSRILVQDARVRPGDELGSLIARTGEVYVEALFSPGTEPRAGDIVSVALAYSDETYEGTVMRVGRLPQPGRAIGLARAEVSGDVVYARIRPAPAIAPALAGDPAVVTRLPAP